MWKALTDAGLVAHVDESLVRLLSERLAQYASLRDEAMGAPTLVPLGSGSLAVNPIIKLRDETSKDCARLMRACALTPLSRRGLAKVRDTFRPQDKEHFMPIRTIPSGRWAHLRPDVNGRIPGNPGYIEPDEVEGDFAT